jgi:hypothetical protein
MSEPSTPSGSYLTRLPFPGDNGAKRYCIEGVMTDDPSGDGVFYVPTPSGSASPGYCVDCFGELGGNLGIYGPGAEKCMRCGSVFLLHLGA